MTAGGAAKSMSATHSGSTSRPAYFHLMRVGAAPVDDAVEIENGLTAGHFELKLAA
jgi:hypothetical protein